MASVEYNWAQAIFDLYQEQSNDLNRLVAVAGLDPKSGDLSDVDFSNVDLSEQNLSGWDLSKANFRDAKIYKTNLRGAKFNPSNLIEAQNWSDALIEDKILAAMKWEYACNLDLAYLQSPLSVVTVLNENNIFNLKGVVEFEPQNILEILTNLNNKDIIDFFSIVTNLMKENKVIIDRWSKVSIGSGDVATIRVEDLLKQYNRQKIKKRKF
ncbi:pentapeptide repeat-containing protein [Methylobacterium sp. Gmos1]